MTRINFDVKVSKAHGIYAFSKSVANSKGIPYKAVVLPHNKGILDVDKKALIFYKEKSPNFCVKYDLNTRQNPNPLFSIDTSICGEVLCIKDNRDNSYHQFQDFNMIHANPLGIDFDEFMQYLNEARQPPKVELTAIMIENMPVLVEKNTLEYLKEQGLNANNLLGSTSKFQGLLEEAPLTLEQIQLIETLLAKGANVSELAKIMSVSEQKIQEVKDGKYTSSSSRIEEIE